MTTIRIACQQDGADLLKIYRPYVTDSTFTFEYGVPSLKEFQERITSTLAEYPFLVAEDRYGKIVGYAYAHAYNNRPGYAWAAELTIYLDSTVKGQGIGRLLYEHLEEALIKQNVSQVVACITGDNQSSLKFHEGMGYHLVAKFEQFAYKHDQWHDIVWMQKSLSESMSKPVPFIPFASR
ncbi:N-acetyltransferase [Vagococcus sp. BWB3-3]|uniref:N-acetyltransferase n=1 Tax=Vagococcus allomyrinae TaxID=2794353 RepID=A0A940PI05_9ENTE|nr:GNAT family N-acetyltransferase [Vagococcus allomyrinae]MBP1044298.1 N-acetyltransferase [Vagococcus allomyrinae]